jgi:hypothetical protein
MHACGPGPLARRAYVPRMLDGRTAMAKHTKTMIGLLLVLVVLTIVIESLG